MNEKFEQLIARLTALPQETEWAEFKANYAKPQEIGEYISALSNSAALCEVESAYIVWGIEDITHKIVGTSFNPKKTKIKGQELENWLVTQLDPRVNVSIEEGEISSRHLVVFIIQPANTRPVSFRGIESIRIGSYKKKLKDHPEKERELWHSFDRTPFEERIALSNLNSRDIEELIDQPSFLKLMNLRIAVNQTGTLERMQAENVIIKNGSDNYSITCLGAVLFAKDLRKFGRLVRKVMRVVIYNGNNRVETIKEQTGQKGYAIGFEDAISYIKDQLPQNEEIREALRRKVRLYPTLAVRELVANALIHQDFSISGAGPLVEIFNDRMEITNPGEPLIDVLRFIDSPPRSRNEILASLMRRMNICEERGSGIDKVIDSVEIYQLPAPDFRVSSNCTIAVLYAPRRFSQMSKQERIRACYQHACLKHVSGQYMANATLRKRLGIKDAAYPQASRIIRDTISVGLVKPRDEDSSSKRSASYVPFWA